jgi:hypothetical protein
MKLGRPFKKLKFADYLVFIPMHDRFSDWNTLGLYRSIIEHATMTIEEKLQVRDLAHRYFQKQFDFLQLKDPKTYMDICSIGQEMTKADTRQLWENVRTAQEKILAEKKFGHRNFGIYGKHDCGYPDCFMNGLMVRSGSKFCESTMRFDTDKNMVSGQIKSERMKRDRKNRKQFIDEGLTELD